MVRRFRPPMFAVAAAMFGLILLLATLQYKWLGQISAAERDRMRATLDTRATGFAHDFDRELTRAYLLFQAEAPADAADAAARLSARYERWQATARFPRMIGAVYVVATTGDGKPTVRKFDAATRALQPADLPDGLQAVREQVAHLRLPHPAGGAPVRMVPPMVLDSVPAIVVHTPLIVLAREGPGALRFAPELSFTILVLDRGYVVNEMLPALADQHFRLRRERSPGQLPKELRAADDVDYQLAVVRPSGNEVLYHSAPGFAPSADTPSDGTVDLFAIRLQEFSALAAEVRRFVTFTAAPSPASGLSAGGRGKTVLRETISLPPGDRVGRREGRSVSILVKGEMPADQKAAFAGFLAAPAAQAVGTPKWKLLVKHPAGSLEAAVQAARRRNVLVSTGVLALLGASMGLLVLSTRRAQRLATQQMEFVAAVSHELRTPLAVIRSAGENLADGVVRDDEQIRKYGDLVRHEGRRLTEMVEQILEFAGIQSGQRGFSLRPVAVRPLLEEVVQTSRPLAERGNLRLELSVPDAMPPILGDGPALRRVFENLVSNAIKYGAGGSWIGVQARADGRRVCITVSDRGIGIAATEHARIFEPFYRTPDVAAAQIHGAGLGLSLVKRIVEAHGGRIDVRSAPGQGSEFAVHLPAASEPIGAAANAAEEGSPSGASAAGIQS